MHVHVDNLGFIWVNLDANDTPSVPWEQDFATVDFQPRLLEFDMNKYHFDHEWEMTGDYNWKVLADNYNEVRGRSGTAKEYKEDGYKLTHTKQCYHCPTGHPALPAVTDLAKYWVETSGAHIQHYAVDRQDEEAKSLGNVSTYLYPNASMTVTYVIDFGEQHVSNLANGNRLPQTALLLHSALRTNVRDPNAHGVRGV